MAELDAAYGTAPARSRAAFRVDLSDPVARWSIFEILVLDVFVCATVWKDGTALDRFREFLELGVSGYEFRCVHLDHRRNGSDRSSLVSEGADSHSTGFRLPRFLFHRCLPGTLFPEALLYSPSAGGSALEWSGGEFCDRGVPRLF